MKLWRVVGDQLVIDGDGAAEQVAAAQIYASIVDSEPVIEGIEPGKSGDAAGLRFSRYPASLIATLEERTAQSTPAVSFALKTQMGQILPVGKDALRSGHAIVSGTWYAIEADALKELREHLHKAGIDDPDQIRTLGGLLSLKVAAAGGDLVEDRLPVGSDAALRFVPAETGVPQGVSATLYPYQLDGWRWLKFVIGEGIGGLLADEMGLGKTLQIISALSDGGQHPVKRTLVIAPGSLLENWRREIAKFAPALTVLKHQGAKRSGNFRELLQYDVVVTSYDTAIGDLSQMKMIEWDAIILDEAQNIRNPGALRTKSVKSIPRKVSLAMTGTPMENRLTDLWSIMDFVAPGYLGTVEEFAARYSDTVDGAHDVEPMVSPLMLRRRVAEVAKDLPERIDIPEAVELTDAEAAEYERIRQDIFQKHGKAATLIALTSLRQFCAHPGIIAGVGAAVDPGSFSKFARLQEILTEIAQLGEKAIVFTSYTAMADMIALHIETKMDIFSATLDGRLAIDDRQPLIDRFSEVEGPAVLVLNPKAGGAGLNITAATHVIHYNLEWNPALEDQASARAHRRGQTRPVTVRRLFCADTVEDVVNDRVQSKREIAETAIVGMQGRDEDYADVIKALERSPISAGGNH